MGAPPHLNTPNSKFSAADSSVSPTTTLHHVEDPKANLLGTWVPGQEGTRLQDLLVTLRPCGPFPPADAFKLQPTEEKEHPSISHKEPSSMCRPPCPNTSLASLWVWG